MSSSSVSPDNSSNVGLTELFQLQDEALRRNLLNQHGVHQYAALLSSLTSVSFDALSKMQFLKEKQTVLRHFGTDTLSHLVVAARVGLWGALPESLSILRGAIEACAQFAFVIQWQKYETVIYEVTKLGRFRQIQFDDACRQLGPLGVKLRKLHGQISDAASHSTVKRFRLLEYDFEGQKYDRLGFSVHPQAAKLVIFHCLLLSTIVCRCLEQAYLQEGLEFGWTSEIDEADRVIDTLSVPSSDSSGKSAEQDQ